MRIAVMTPIQMGRDPIKIRSRWCLLTGGQLNNFKKVRTHTESNFNIVFIKQTSTGFKDTHNTASRSVVRTLVTLMSWAHGQHIQTPTFLQLFTLYLLIFKPTSCTYHILHISHPARITSCWRNAAADSVIYTWNAFKPRLHDV